MSLLFRVFVQVRSLISISDRSAFSCWLNPFPVLGQLEKKEPYKWGTPTPVHRRTQTHAANCRISKMSHLIFTCPVWRIRLRVWGCAYDFEGQITEKPFKETWLKSLMQTAAFDRAFKDTQTAPKPRLMPASCRNRAQCCAYNSNSVHIIRDQIETNGPCGPTEPHYWWKYFTALSTVKTNSLRISTLDAYELRIGFPGRTLVIPGVLNDNPWVHTRFVQPCWWVLSGTWTQALI